MEQEQKPQKSETFSNKVWNITAAVALLMVLFWWMFWI